MASVSAPIKKVRYMRVTLRLLMPRLSGKSKKMAIAAIVGIDKRILARAEPRAKLRLCLKKFEQ